MSDWTGLSASGAGPAIACPPRLALPQARTSGEPAERGNHLHTYARVSTVNPAARALALLEVPEKYRHTAEGMNLDLALEGLRIVGCERAYALNVKTRTVRYIGENIDRNYNEELARRGEPPLSKYEIAATMDVEAFYQVTPVEMDYKSGLSIGDPAEHWQRRICATVLMIHHDTPTAISRVAYIRDDGQIHPDGTEFSILDVDDFCDTLVKTIDAICDARLKLANGVMPTVYPSDEACNYCSAMTSCPYWNNFAKSMVGRLEAIEKGPALDALTPEEQGRVWEDLKRSEKIIEIALKGLKKAAEQAPFPVGDKYEVRPQDKSRTYFDDAKARGLIMTLMQRLGADDDEIKAQLVALNGKTEYVEYRKVKRQLPVVIEEAAE